MGKTTDILHFICTKNTKKFLPGKFEFILMSLQFLEIREGF